MIRPALTALLLLIAAPADAQDFQSCLNDLAGQARAKGLGGAFRAASPLLTPDPSLARLAEAQPEFSRQPWDYIEGIVSTDRIAEGRKRVAANKALLEQVEAKFGVDRYIVAAIWGMETNFGGNKGNKNILRSTATLACSGRRQEFFTGEFLAALSIVQAGHIAADEFNGSWAGAFGHTQFMPTTYQRAAVDFDGDAHPNLIQSTPDALASTANYLRMEGWKQGQGWGYEVKLPPGFNFMQADRTKPVSLAEWEKRGVKRIGDKPFARKSDVAFMLLPGGAKGPAFLMLPNFMALLRYNTSDNYALAVGHLADRLRGGGGFAQSWPRSERALSLTERRQIQEALVAMGYDIGGQPDGRIGQKSREALRQFQSRSGMVPDGFATVAVLARLRRGS